MRRRPDRNTQGRYANLQCRTQTISSKNRYGLSGLRTLSLTLASTAATSASMATWALGWSGDAPMKEALHRLSAVTTSRSVEQRQAAVLLAPLFSFPPAEDGRFTANALRHLVAYSSVAWSAAFSTVRFDRTLTMGLYLPLLTENATPV